MTAGVRSCVLSLIRKAPFVCLVMWSLAGCTVKNNAATVVDAATSPGPDGGKVQRGGSCSADGDCADGVCSSGICCTSACNGPCESCDVTGHVGVCSPVPEAAPPAKAGACPQSNVASCGLDGTCDGRGGCRKYPDNTPCEAGVCNGAQLVAPKQCQAGVCTAGANQSCAPFNCDKATSTCLAECKSDADCTSGRACKDGSCGKKPIGLSCAANSECDSGTCADGVCCNTVCDGPCVTCKDATQPGQCVPAKAGADDPHSLCAKADVSTCGFSGKCNGQGGCARYSAGTVCTAGSCAGGSFMPAAVCNAQGSCQLGSAITCAPFVCTGGACKTACAGNQDCVAPATCNNGSCGKRGLGQTCASADQCGSGFCADGVCCESSCDGLCRNCALPASPGRCVAVPANTPDPRYTAGQRDPAKVCIDGGAAACGKNGMCNGAGGCEVYASGTVCKAGSCSATTNIASPQSTCNGNGACMSSPTLACTPFKCSGNRCADLCASDSDCVAPNVCRNGSCGKKGNGQVCSTAAECQSGACAQGVCCGTACDKGCFSCAIPGKEGMCSAVPNGSIDPAGLCKDMGGISCGTDGTCNGAGSCRLYAETTICRQANCTNGETQTTSYCSGTGICIAGTKRSCDPYTCNAAGTSCIDSCQGNAECVAGNTCVEGRCGTKGLGGSCTTAADCASTFCIDGVCCDTDCTGTCRACNLSGSAGTCSNVPSGSTDLAGNCAATAAGSCGTNGQCNGQGGCSNWSPSTMCTVAMCPSGGGTLSNAGFCNGQGACLMGGTQSCGEFLCDSSSATCKSTCTPETQTADCKAGSNCVVLGSSYSCGLKPKGSGCAATTECMANLTCVDGTCCDKPSCGICQSCKNAQGTCANVPDGSNDFDTCTADNTACGLIGKCNGAGACKQAPSGTLCGNSTCSADGNSEIRPSCNGGGTCAPVTVACANGLKCVNNACKTRCDSDADCQPAYKCPGKSGTCKLR